MHFCRICRTEKNLKYTTKQLRQIYKKHNKYEEKLLDSTPTMGNICHDCEDRLHNFHRYDVDGDLTVDLGYETGIAGMADQKETDVIIDDDELLYNLFLKKVAEQRIAKAASAIAAKCPCNTTEKTEACHNSLDSEADIIEVLTSRENTPIAFLEKPNNNQKIIAIIDLENDVVLEKQENKTAIPIKEHNTSDNVKSPSALNNKSNRKKYADNELRLIASWSLISSDSEVDETQTKTTDCTKSPTLSVKSINSKPANTENCPVCRAEYQSTDSLIHHMRCKHRTYDGHTLSERPRCSQDSAMTIRLRYLHRQTYYECQLCGRIDAVFRSHKEHIMDQHSEESKCLKDPMMKELKCPICKVRCGAQNIRLCKHILKSHTENEYKPHLKEITRGSTHSWLSSRHKHLTELSRVFQIAKRSNYFFECTLCKKVVGGYIKQLQHLKTHANSDTEVKINDKQHEEKHILKKKSTSKTTTIRDDNREKISKASIGVGGGGGTTKKYAPKKSSQPNKKQRIHKENKKAIKAALVKVKVKPPIRKFPAQKYLCKFCQLTFKGFYLLNLHQLTKHQRDEYLFCNICEKAFISSSELALHTGHHNGNMLRRKRKAQCPTESVDENCNSNYKFHTIENALNEKLNITPLDSMENDRWLKDLLHLAQSGKHNLTTNTASGNHECLKDNTSNMINTYAYQCNYCAHLFETAKELGAHEDIHMKQEDFKLMKRLDLKT